MTTAADVDTEAEPGLLARMGRALSEYLIRGIKTTIPFQQSIMHHPDFVAGKYDTGFVGKLIESRMDYKK